MTDTTLLYGYTSKAALELFPNDAITIVNGVPHRTIGPDDVVMSDAELALIKDRAAELAVPLPRRIGSAREYMSLFTSAELLAIVTLSMSNAELKLWYDEALAGEVSLDHPDVTAGLSTLTAIGVITQERSNEILTADFNV